ncbi:MAG: tRNA1(Val) (adenine(37)-N6)-methyltransferase [Clostridia bacterium]
MMNPNELTLDDLRIGGFRLFQPKKGYRFAVDAPILAALAPVAPGMSVLDLGCGGGVLSLLLLGREPSLKVSGIELRQKAYDLAVRNTEYNRADVRLVRGDAMKAASYFTPGSFDLILSNPPFYPADECRLPKDEEVAAAKTELYWDQEIMMEQAFSLLKEEGRFALIFDAVRGEELLRLGEKAGLYPVSSRMIYTRRGEKEPKRVYLLFSRSAVPFIEEPPLVLYEKTGEETSELKRIFEIYHGTGTVSCGDAHWEPR